MTGYSLGDLVDIYRLQSLVTLFHGATGIPVSILDRDGRTLVSAGWPNICTQFHRRHPATSERCRQSDDHIRIQLQRGDQAEHKCGNGMWDIATPIKISGRDVATLTVGQFFYDDDPPDRELFIRQAQKCGFDIKTYLEALDQVPVFSRQRMRDIMAYCSAFTDFLCKLGLNTHQLVQELGEKRRAQEEMRNSLGLLTTLINTIPNPVYFQDRESVILGCNTAFAKQIVGLGPDEVIGRSLADLPTTNLRGMVEDQSERDRQLVEKPGSLTYEGQILCSSGQLRDFLFSKGTYLGGDGEPAGLVCILVDITDRRRVEENLKRANENAEAANRDLAKAIEHANALASEAESANRAKDEFLANMSHELRTPLNGVIGMASMLEESGLNAEQHSFLKVIQNCGQVLLTLVNELLDYSRIEANRLDLQVIDFDLRVTLDELRATLTKRAEEKKLRLLMLISPQVPSLVRGDPGRLRQVLMHLVGNAIKFTERGRVVVRVGLEMETDIAAQVRFNVTDTGIGIPRERLDQIFQAFTQLDSSTTRRYGGAGMGLALSKRLVEAQGGRIGAGSEPGKGTTFWFTVQMEKQSLERRVEQATAADIHGTRVLIAEGAGPSREILTLQLQRAGCRPDQADSGAHALGLLRQASREHDPVAVVIAEKNLGDMTAIDLGRAIKSDPGLHDTALMLLTATGRRGDAAAVQAVGYSAYLTKPAQRDLLVRCLSAVVARRAHGGEQPAALITKYSLEETRRRRLRILVAESSDGNQRALLHALHRLGYSADTASDWAEAIEVLSSHPYDIVFMDSQMPPARVLRSTADLQRLICRHGQVHMVAMVASGTEQEDESSRRVAALMDGQLSRPVDAARLTQLIGRLRATRGSSPEEQGEGLPQAA
jgi:two-component system, sensor histidine kinase and response regulator